MATLRDFAPGLGDGTLPSAAPGLRPVSVADMPVNYAPDNSALERTMERDGMSQARLGYESMRLGDKANWLEVEAAAREAAGDLQGAQALRARNAGLRQESGFYAPKEQDITRIGLDEPGRILDYGLGAVGSVAASMQDGMASGAGAKLATNALGMIPHPFTQAIGRGANLLSAGAAFVPNLMSNSGEQLSSYRDDPTIMANTTAGERLARGLGTGAVMGALDTLPEVGMLSRLGGKGAAHGIMRGTALDTAKEMATETAQTGVQKLDLSNLNPGRDTTDDWRDYANSAAQAGMGGAPLHGAANVLGAMGSRVREPGDPGMNKGDEIDLKAGKKTDGTLASFDEQLKAAGSPGQFKSLKEAENRRDLLTGRGFGDVDTHGPEEAFASNRQAALLEELSKTNTPEAQAHAAKVAAVDISDPFSTFDHPDFEAASDYVTPRAGLDFDGLDRLAKGFKNKRVKKNERLFAPQDHIPLGGELSMRAKTVAGLIEQLRPDAEEGKREPADMRSFLRATARDIVSMVNMEGEPSEGELVRAKRLGSIVGSYLGDNTEAGLAQLGKAAGGKTNKLFEAFASHAALHSGKADAVTSKTIEDDGAELADRVVGMIPQERIDALQTKGINLYEPRVQSHLVRSLQAMFDGHGDGSITLERAEQMFGKEAVSEIEKLIGLNLGRGFGDETDQFERDAKEKSITTAGEKIGDGTAAFGRGMKKNGIALGDLFDAKKNGLLPSLWSPGEHGDSVRDAMERDVAGASEKDAHVRTLPVTRVLEAQGFRGGSLKHKRLELMERYLDAAAKKARDPKAVEKLTALKTALGELRQGERFDKQLTDIFQGRDSLGPDGGRMTVNQRASLKKLAYGGGMVDEGGGGAPRMEYSPIAKFLGEDHPLSADLRRFGAAGKSAKEILDTPELHTIMHKAVREAVAKHLATIGKLAPGLLRNDANGEPANASTDLAERYFEDKHLTLATPTGTTATPDHLKLTKIAFRQMTKRGGEVAGLIRGGKVRDAADEGLLFFYGSKADADADKKDGVYNRPTESKRMAAVKGDDIVAWVRAGEYSHTKTVGGGKERKATGNRAYFDLLSQGIGALVDGHAHTMPVDIKGGSDYRLETSSVGAIAKARDKAATARAAEAAEFMGPPDSRGVGATEEQRDAELAKDYAHEEVAELHADGFYEDGTTSEADPDQEADEFEHVRLKNTVYAAARMPEEISVRSGSLERDARRHGEALWGDYLKDREAGLARIIGVAKEMAQNPLLAAVLAFVATPEHLRAMAPRLVVNNENIGGQATDTVKDYALLRGLRVDVAKTILGGTGYGKNLVRPKDIDALQEALGGKLEDIIKSAKAKGWSPMSYAPAVPRIEITQEERKATPGKAMEGALRSSIEERKVQRLEKELSEIDGKLAELRKTVAPITKLKAEIAARKDTASYVATERKTGDVPRSAAVEGHTAPATASRRERYRKGFRLAHEAGPDGAAKAKPLTPAEIKAGRNAAKVNLAAELKAMRTELRSMIQATGFADLRTMRAEMAALSARKTDITKVLADADRRTTPSTTEMRTGENWAPIAGGKVVETPVAKKVKAKVEPASTGLAALPQHKPGQKTMRYAGIGSRRTPPEMAARMTKVAQWLAKQGYTLFSGGADGADKAFEAGAGTTKEIFRASDATDAMIAVAREVHPRPEALREYPLKLMARNTAQVFGRDLSEPVDFVLAWTPDGAEATAERTISTGGTGQAIDLASRKGVPVINLAREGWEARLKAAVAGETKPAADKTIVGDLWAQPGVKIVGVKLNQRDFPAGTAKTAQRATNTATQPTPSDADIEAIRGQIDRLLGPKIKAAFEEAFGANGSWDNVTKIVTIALAPLAQMKSVAYHEGMHAFFSERLAAMPEVKAMLYRAMEEPRVKERLQFLLRNSPAALKAMERDPEEAVAYAFEFWTEGLLSLGKSPTTFFERVQRFFRGVFGMISDGERSLEIFQALYDGKMVEPSAAEKAIQEAMSRGEGMRAAALKVDKQGRWLKTRIMAANRVLAETGPVGKALADQWYVNPGSTKQGTDAGVMNRRQSEMRKRTNRLYSEVIHGLNQQEVEALNDLAESKTDVEQVEDPRLKKALGNLYRLSADMYRYIKDAGVETGVRDDGRYTPMVWSQQYMIEHKDKFVAMLLEHYPDMLKAAKATAGQVAGKNLTPEDVAAHMWQSIIDRTGVDAKMEAQRDDGVLSPFFASENGRSFDWIAPEHRKEFLSHDIVHNMTSYIHQAVRSAEYVRTFGSRGHLLAATLQRVGDYIGTNKDGTPKYADEDGPLIEEIRAKAVADKVPTDKLEAYVLRRHDAARESVGAMEGVLGKDISDIARKANSYLMTYQHLRLLPLSLFAAMLDPVGIMVSGGTLDDAIGAYVRGMRGVVKTWKSLATGIPLTLDGDQDEMDAMMVGTLDSDMLLEGVGNAHTGEYMDKGVRRINHKFFELNGLTAWDRSMRVVATRTGIKFIMSHDKNSNPAHSKRWMEALGLEQGKLIYGADGKLVLDARVLAKIRAEGKAGSGEKFAALSDDQRQTLIDTETRAAEEYMNKLHFGIQRFVQRGVLSPNAAVRPAWASDPHYAAVFHLKQYTYGFHEIIMRHIREEAEAGNYAPGMMALVGVPVMIAADITKGLLTGGGSLPGYMANWGLADWLMHGWARAGLNGIGQIGIDTIHNPASIFGPTADQIADFALSPLDKLEHADMVPGVRIIMR